MGGGYEASLKMDPEGMGVIPRIVQEMFLNMDDKESYEYKVKVSYLEVKFLPGLSCSKHRYTCSLTSSLVVKMLTVLVSTMSNSQVFLLKK